MTRKELDATLARLGLEVPELEREELLQAVRYVDDMAQLVRTPLAEDAEAAHLVTFPKDKHD